MRISDWSSDVCSSDLTAEIGGKAAVPPKRRDQRGAHPFGLVGADRKAATQRLQMVHRLFHPGIRARVDADVFAVKVQKIREACLHHLDRKSTRLNSSN